MRKFILAATAAVAAATAMPAVAQEAAPFTGLRIEGLIGYDQLSDGEDQDSSSSDGIGYGAAIGYDFQAGPVVAGIEGEITGTTVDTRTDNLLVAGDRFRLDGGRDLYAGGRVGLAISPLALGYVKAGYTNAQLDARYDASDLSFDDSFELDGFRVGAGLEYKFGVNTYLKGEYRYSNYGQAEGYDIDVDRHQLVAGFGLRF